MSYIHLLNVEAQLTNFHLIQLARLNHNFHSFCKINELMPTHFCSTDGHWVVLFTKSQLDLFLNFFMPVVQL